MTVLRKDRTIEIIPGNPGQKAVPAIPGSPGGYVYVDIVRVGCLPKPGATPPVSYGWRLATYNEILIYLCSRYIRDDKCAVVKKIMETTYNTSTLFTSIATIDYGHFLTVGTKPGSPNTIGICVAERFATDYEQRDNPAHTSFWWNFADYYTCTVVDGVEHLVQI